MVAIAQGLAFAIAAGLTTALAVAVWFGAKAAFDAIAKLFGKEIDDDENEAGK